MTRLCARRKNRRGTATIEAAFILPVFFTFLFFLFAYGHAQMVNNLLKTACRNGARFGSTEGVSNQQVRARVQQIVASAIDPAYVSIIIKDASVFDRANADLPDTPAEYNAMPDLELSAATPRQMFLVRASVNYNNVSILALPWTKELQLTGQAVSRHE